MRAFIAVVVVCVLAFVAAAWWFQWWNIAASPSDDGSKTEVRFSVDRDKVKHDVAAARKSILGSGHETKEGVREQEKALSHAQPAEGTIRSLDPAGHSFTVLSKGQEVTVRTDAATRFRVGDNEGALSDLAVGDRVTMTYAAGTGEVAARTVTVEKRS